ncbi:hypothetical protein BGW42_003845 [Actinomortierella wolfii]|nr:hypothetical protein BGW42_003845 [Actinomortierella wolfii]
MRTFLLGVLFALGTFTRITFVLYGFPLGVTFLIVVGKAALAQPPLRSSPQSPSHSPSSTPQPSLPKAALRFIASCLPLALGISMGVAVNVIMDSLYFGKLTIVQSSTQEAITRWVDLLNPRTWRDLEFQGSLTVTFLNNLLYNLDENNLAEHGLHPRYLHLLVNFPVLYANLAYVGIRAIGEKAIAQRHYTSHSTMATGVYYMHREGEATFVTHTIFYKTYMPPYHLFGLNEQEAGAHGLQLQISDWRSLSHYDLIQALSKTPGAKDAHHRERIEQAFAEDPRKTVFIETSPGIYWR